MKILLLTDRMHRGGAESHIFSLALGLRAQGNEVALLSAGGTLADELERRGIKQHRIAPPTHNPLRLLSIRKTILRLIRKEGYEVLHAHTRMLGMLLRGMNRRGVAVLVTVHAAFRVNAVLSRLCYWGEQTLAVSEDLRAYVCKYYRVPAERVEVIPNGIDTRLFSADTAFGVSEECAFPKRVLFASRLDSDCALGAELLCRIAPDLRRLHPDLEITIAGDGNVFGKISALAEKANREIGADAVHMVGWVSDMPRLIREHDIFVGVSRAAMEACAAAKAVILCGNEGYFGILTPQRAKNAMLSNFCARGCEKADEITLRDDLCHLLDAPNETKRLGLACRTLIRAHFEISNVCKRTLTCYERTRPLSKTASVALCGYFGCGNLGDDAILQGLLHHLRETAPQLRVRLLTGSPRRDKKRYRVSAHSRKNPISVLLTLLRSDALLFSGGSLLQNITSKRSLSYYLCLIRLARGLRREVFFCGAGIGPLLGESSCHRVKNALNQCRSVGLRDDGSARALRRLSVRPELLHQSGDLALLLPPPSPCRADFLLQKHRLSPTRRLFCVVLHGGAEAAPLLPLLLTAVRTVCRRQALTPILLLLDAAQDGGVTYAASHSLSATVIRHTQASDVGAILAVCQGVLTLRLHAMVLAASVGTPALGIPADPRDEKIISFAHAVGADALLAEELSVPILTERIESMLEDAERLRPLLRHAVEEMQKKAAKDLANTVQMIYNNKQNEK